MVVLVDEKAPHFQSKFMPSLGVDATCILSVVPVAHQPTKVSCFLVTVLSHFPFDWLTECQNCMSDILFVTQIHVGHSKSSFVRSDISCHFHPRFPAYPTCQNPCTAYFPSDVGENMMTVYNAHER